MVESYENRIASCPIPAAGRAVGDVGVFEFLEGFYNRTRLHSSLGYLSPAEFEGQRLAI